MRYWALPPTGRSGSILHLRTLQTVRVLGMCRLSQVFALTGKIIEVHHRTLFLSFLPLLAILDFLSANLQPMCSLYLDNPTRVFQLPATVRIV